MLTMEEAMRQSGNLPLCRWRNRQRHHHRSPPQGSPRGHRLQERGRHLRQRVRGHQDRQGRRRDGRPDREARRQGRHGRPLQGEGRVQDRTGNASSPSATKAARIAGKVKAIVKGGLLVNIGVEAFLPASQIDIITAQEPRSSSSATPTISRSSRSTRSGRTSSSPAAN